MSSETSGSSWANSRSAASTMVTVTPNRANTWPNSRPIAPPPSTISEPGRVVVATASRFVQYGVSANPGTGGTDGTVPVARTTPRRALTVRPSTLTTPGPANPARPGRTGPLAGRSAPPPPGHSSRRWPRPGSVVRPATSPVRRSLSLPCPRPVWFRREERLPAPSSWLGYTPVSTLPTYQSRFDPDDVESGGREFTQADRYGCGQLQTHLTSCRRRRTTTDAQMSLARTYGSDSCGSKPSVCASVHRSPQHLGKQGGDEARRKPLAELLRRPATGVDQEVVELRRVVGPKQVAGVIHGHIVAQMLSEASGEQGHATQSLGAELVPDGGRLWISSGGGPREQLDRRVTGWGVGHEASIEAKLFTRVPVLAHADQRLP